MGDEKVLQGGTSSAAVIGNPTLEDQLQSTTAAADPIIPATAPTTLSLPSSSPTLGAPQCDDEKINAAPSRPDSSRSTTASGRLTSDLPAGCHWGPVLTPELAEMLRLRPEESSELGVGQVGDGASQTRVIWVDFPPLSPQNPFFFSTKRKLAITVVATFFTMMTAANTSAYSIGEVSMCKDLGCNDLQAAGGLGVYAFGFAVAPMVLAPLSEEFGRRWTYVCAVIIYLVFHIMMAASKNYATMMIARVLQGCSGSVGSTLVGGTIADVFMPAQRGLPSSVFALAAVAGSGFGSFWFAWVESNPKLEWRWIWWIQTMIIGALLPCIFFTMRETRDSIILRRRAKKMRKEHGLDNGGRYTARSEVGKVGFVEAMTTSCSRPITFLVIEPVVTFFALWMAVAWGVLFVQIGGLPYVFRNVYGFTTNQVGLVYLSLVIGALVGFCCNFIQDAVYRRRVEKDGIEARLYAPMVAGLVFSSGCFIFAFTSLSSVHWIAPAIGLVLITAAILTIYISAFVYLAECYGSYASSAIAAQSFLRNAFGGSFSLFTLKMYRALTPRWMIFTWGCVSLVLAAVPFIAYYHGPKIRAHSKYSKILMKAEQERIAKEKEVLDGLG
ncbi:hypothetical protein IAT38_005293 [Cryptococcus sp. DSM 104549]